MQDLTPMERKILTRVRRMAAAGVMPTAALITSKGSLALAESPNTVKVVMDRLVRRGLLRIGPMVGKARTWLPIKGAQ